VGTNAPVVSVDVGVRIAHPRVSDLVLRLISPSGTRVLLAENRGGASAQGMGLTTTMTNLGPVSTNGGPLALTNVLNTGQTSGTLEIAYRFYSEPDEMWIYYDGVNIFDSGYVPTVGTAYILTNINYGPGTDTVVTIAMNEHGEPFTNDVWDYVVTAVSPGFIYATFTENTNLATVPIKYAPPPFTNVEPVTVGGVQSNGIFFLPEQSLAALAGEPAQGTWSLEIDDTRAGPAPGSNAPTLLGWELNFVLAQTAATPIPLAHHEAVTNLVAPGKVQTFSLAVPSWALFATNSLVSATAPVNLLFNQSQPPSGTNGPGDYTLLAETTSGTAVLHLGSGHPSLEPGATCYLGLQNPGAAPVSVVFEADFNAPVLGNADAVGGMIAAGGQPDYYAFEVSTQATVVLFELTGVSGNAGLYADFGLPFPTPAGADYSSAVAGTNYQQILVLQGSFPQPVAPGWWYLGVFNQDTNAICYNLEAAEFSVNANHLTILGYEAYSYQFCITWSSTPGSCYYVQGAVGAGTNWENVSRTLVATGYQTTYCAALPSRYDAFMVQPGVIPTTNLPPVTITSVSVQPAGVQLEWRAATSSQFQVQWSPVLGPASWTPFPDLTTSSTGLFTFVDDGSQSGGLGPERFYRLQQLP
jgi:subtilisin-like proprotein convertase family protein